MTMSSPPIIGNNLKINDSVKKNMYINESNIQIIKRGGKIHQLNKTAQCIEIKQKHGIMSWNVRILKTTVAHYYIEIELSNQIYIWQYCFIILKTLIVSKLT